MGKPLKIEFGGPSYCLQVDAEHSAGAFLLGACLVSRGCRVQDLAPSYQHGTPVDIPRNELFADALSRDADVLIWWDSDSFIDSEDIYEFSALPWALMRGTSAFLGVATPQRNGNLNVWERADTAKRMKMTHKHFAQLGTFGVHATGLGVALFHLKMFREKWGQGPWFTSKWDGQGFESEDYNFTSQLSSRGLGAPGVTPLMFAKHQHRGGRS